MLVVDTSVWIAHLRDIQCEPVDKLRTFEAPSEILVGDLILLEVLQGARDDLHAARLEEHLRQFELAKMLDDALASEAARHYRLLRQKGVTVRKTVDVIIATFCITGNHLLLHADKDFDPFVEHCGLQTL